MGKKFVILSKKIQKKEKIMTNNHITPAFLPSRY